MDICVLKKSKFNLTIFFVFILVTQSYVFFVWVVMKVLYHCMVKQWRPFLQMTYRYMFVDASGVRWRCLLWQKL